MFFGKGQIKYLNLNRCTKSINLKAQIECVTHHHLSSEVRTYEFHINIWQFKLHSNKKDI